MVAESEKVRIMNHNGEFNGFRLGKLIGIPRAQVEHYECQNTPSPSTGENGHSPLGMGMTAAESRLVRQTVVAPRLSPVSGGIATPQRQAIG